jgi:hypothetical protein
MTPNQHELLASIQGLARSGAMQTDASIHYNEATSSRGWVHINVTAHQHGSIVLSLYAGVSPDGNDTPSLVDHAASTLADVRDQLVEFITTHRKQEAA